MSKCRITDKIVIPKSEAHIHFNLDEVPAYKRDELAQGALELMRRLFAEPGTEERFQAWLVEYRKRKAAEAAAVNEGS